METGVKKSIKFEQHLPTILGPQPDLHKKRAKPEDRLGQIWWRDLQLQKQAPYRRLGFDRLGHMQSVGIPFKFEEFQGKHPFDFVDETKEHFKEPARVAEKSQKHVETEDTTAFPTTEWMEPIRKGQAYWDYCRDKWMSKTSQLGAALASATSMYSLWSVADRCLQNGGCAFMAAYLVIIVLFTIPMIYIELAIGQFCRFGMRKTIRSICPLFLGVGYLMLVLCFVDYIFSMTRLTWLLFYMATSLQPELPWRECNQHWNTKNCKATRSYDQVTLYYSSKERTPAVEHFRINVISNSHDTPKDFFHIIPYGPHLGVLFCYICLLILLHYLTKMRCQQLGRNMYFTFQLAFFLILVSFLLRSFNTPVEYEKKIVASTFNWFFDSGNFYNYISDKNTWVAAFKHTIVSTGVGTGIHVTLGSHNPFVNHEIKYNAVLTCVAGYLVHCVVAMFFILCHFALRATESFEGTKEFNVYGTDTVFEIFPQVVAQHRPEVGLSWTMFNTMAGGLLLFGLLRALCSLHAILQYFCDKHKLYYETPRTDYNFWETQRAYRQKRYTFQILSARRKSVLMKKILFFLGLLQILTFFHNGEIWLHLAELFWYKYIYTLVILLECIVIFFFLGVRSLDSYIRKMTTWQVTIWYRFLWKCITPMFPVLYFIHFYPYLEAKEDNIENPFINYPYAGLEVCLLILLFLFFQAFLILFQAHCKTWLESILLMTTPIHEHEDIANGIRPLTRFHWMHHASVPAGIGRGACLNPKGVKYPVVRFQFPRLEKSLWNLLVTTFLPFLNDGDGWKLFTKLPFFPRYNEPQRRKQLAVFPKNRLKFQTVGGRGYGTNYLPNQQILNVIQMRKQPMTEMRKKWMKEKLEYQPVKKKTPSNQANSAKPNSGAPEKEKPSSSDIESSSGSHTSEWDDDLSITYKVSSYSGTSDESESEDWNRFSDSSLYSTDIDHDHHKRKNSAEEGKGVDNGLQQSEAIKRSQSFERLLMKQNEHFEDFAIDELDEFEDIMDEVPEDKNAELPNDFFSDVTSETDTDTSSDSARELLELLDEQDDDCYISDEHKHIMEEKYQMMKKKVRDKKENKEEKKKVYHVLTTDEESFSSCSSSCSSGSDWSKRGQEAPKLGENRASVIRKDKEDYERKSFQENLRRSAYAMEKEQLKNLRVTRITGDGGTGGGDKKYSSHHGKTGFFTDVKLRLQNYLSLNVTTKKGRTTKSDYDDLGL